MEGECSFFDVKCGLKENGRAWKDAVLPDTDAWKECGSNPGLSEDCVSTGSGPAVVQALQGPQTSVKKTEKAADGVPGCKCFLAGTGVLMADGSTRTSRTSRLGDKVLRHRPGNRRDRVQREVTATIVTDDDKHFNELTIATATASST